jgi:hypothetical protein
MGIFLSKRELAQTEPAERLDFKSPVPTRIVSNSVPLAASEGEVERAQARKTLSLLRGTEGSNPPPSTGEMLWGRRRGDGTIVAASN